MGQSINLPAEITTAKEALELISTLAQHFNLAGAGYVSHEDIANSIETMQASVHSPEELPTIKPHHIEEIYAHLANTILGESSRSAQLEELDTNLEIQFAEIVENTSLSEQVPSAISTSLSSTSIAIQLG